MSYYTNTDLPDFFFPKFVSYMPNCSFDRQQNVKESSATTKTVELVLSHVRSAKTWKNATNSQ